MADAAGHDEPELNPVVAPDPSAIPFNELCLWLERVFPQPGGIGATVAPGRETVRFRANPSLGFPAEEIDAITLPDGPGRPVHVTANLFGLHGPSSPLPPALTERIIQAEDGDALRDFLDLFNHRLMALLFRVWKHYRHQHRYRPGATDPISGVVAALFGLYGEDADGTRTARTLLLPYTGVLALYSRSATAVASVVGHCFGLPCTVEEFVHRRIAVPEESRWYLGRPGLTLGVETVAGESMEDVTGQFRLRLGPVTAQECDRMLPGGQDYQKLVEIVRLCVRDPLAWDVAFIMAPGEARPFILGETRLGRWGWLDPSPQESVEFLA